jgi:hypothetical protein
MAATAMNDRVRRGADAVSEGQLLDVLYEILAQGGDGHGKASVEDVERFLHEHARSRKSLEQMRAFFQQHGLSTDPASYSSDPELSEVASGLHRERSPSSVIMPLDEHEADHDVEPVTGRVAAPAPLSESPFGEEFSGIVKKSRTNKPASAASWPRGVTYAGLALVAAGFLAMYLRADHLENELVRARSHQQTTDSTLTKLEKRAGTLSESLSSSEAQRTQLNQQFDAYVTAQQQERAREQAVLERLLGTRYRKQLEQARTAATAATPAH